MVEALRRVAPRAADQAAAGAAEHVAQLRRRPAAQLGRLGRRVLRVNLRAAVPYPSEGGAGTGGRAPQP